MTCHFARADVQPNNNNNKFLENQIWKHLWRPTGPTPSFVKWGEEIETQLGRPKKKTKPHEAECVQLPEPPPKASGHEPMFRKSLGSRACKSKEATLPASLQLIGHRVWARAKCCCEQPRCDGGQPPVWDCPVWETWVLGARPEDVNRMSPDHCSCSPGTCLGSWDGFPPIISLPLCPYRSPHYQKSSEHSCIGDAA